MVAPFRNSANKDTMPDRSKYFVLIQDAIHYAYAALLIIHRFQIEDNNSRPSTSRAEVKLVRR